MAKIPMFQESINTLVTQVELEKLTTVTFQKLSPEKKCTLILAICVEACSNADPGTFNIKEVAKQANMSVGSMYKYFDNRENMLHFIILLVRDYMLVGIEYSTLELLKLPLNQALYYYCTGAQIWSIEEQLLSRFLYKAAYSGNALLSEKLIKPVAAKFVDTIAQILKQAVANNKLKLLKPLEYSAAYVYTSLLPIADSLVYPELRPYTFPGGLKADDIPNYIDTIVKGICSYNS